MRRASILGALLLALLLLPPAIGRVGPASAATALTWRDCGGGFECATLRVPLDYGAPSGKTIDLALNRLPAADNAHRIGSLVTNPGGPGASGIDFVRAWAPRLDRNIRDRFDIVGFDPRGVGASSPIVCHDNLQAWIAADPSPDSQAEWDTLAAVTGQFTDNCAKRYAALLPYLGTKSVARDLDVIRAALGDEMLTYLGYSYGTVIGQVYADMFPTRIRAMVLDGAVDLSLGTDDRTLLQAAGFERALASYAADCRMRSCALARNGADPITAIESLLAKSDAAPIPSRNADRPAGPGEAILGIITPLYSKDAWPSLTRALQAGLDGDGTQLVRLTDAYLERRPDGSYANAQEANLAVNCLDQQPSQLPTRYQDYAAAAARFAATSPHFGPALANGLTCASWPAKPDPLAAPRAEGAPPILVVSTRGDPATPYEWGVAVSKQLATGVLLTFEGDGHTAYGGNDACIDRAVNSYLLQLTAPQTTACPEGAAPVRTGTADTGGVAAVAAAKPSPWRGVAVAVAVIGAAALVGSLVWAGARRRRG